MKTFLLAITCLASGLSAPAQTTYANYKLTFVEGPGGAIDIYAQTNIPVGTNVLARLVSFQPSVEVSPYPASTFSILYPGDSEWVYFAPTQALNMPILGPCTVQIYAQANSLTAPAYALMQFDPVNVSPSPNGGIALPAGLAANVELQGSTNLTDWFTATNGAYAKTNGNRFFRVKLGLTQ